MLKQTAFNVSASQLSVPPCQYAHAGFPTYLF